MITLEMIKKHLQDFPSKNFLLEEDEFTKEEIEIAFKLAQEGYNSLPPVHIIFSSASNRLDDIILEGTLARMYRGKAYQQARNELNFQDGTAAGSIDNKFQYYIQIANQMWADFERRAQAFKKFLNISDGYGAIGSEYSTLPDY